MAAYWVNRLLIFARLLGPRFDAAGLRLAWLNARALTAGVRGADWHPWAGIDLWLAGWLDLCSDLCSR
jgi:hypothetical protein